MKHLLFILLATVSAPALGQHEGHTTTPDTPQTADPHVGHAMPPPPPPTTDPHAGHAMPATPQAADPHAGHAMPEAPQAADPHAGHAMPAQPEGQADPHAGHQMGSVDAPAPPVAPPPPEAMSGPRHAADAVHDEAEMARARESLRETHGGLETWKFMVDQLEYSAGEDGDGYAWEDVQFWYGGDLDRLWIKSEGEGSFDEGLEGAEVQALWSRAIGPFFDLQTGVRYDFGPRPDRFHLALGVQGLAPYWFEVDAAAFVSEKGDFTARFEGEHDVRITQRLILQPRGELEFSLQDVPELGLGPGLTTAEAGLRLRYEIVPEFAPYVGLQYERAFGDTSAFRRLAGEDVGSWSVLAGVRAWF